MDNKIKIKKITKITKGINRNRFERNNSTLFNTHICLQSIEQGATKEIPFFTIEPINKHILREIYTPNKDVSEQVIDQHYSDPKLFFEQGDNIVISK